MIGKTFIIGVLVSFAGAVLVSQVASNGTTAREPAPTQSLALQTAGIAVAAR